MYVAYLIGCNRKVPTTLIVRENLEDCQRSVETLYSSFSDYYIIVKDLTDEEEETHPDCVSVKFPDSEVFEFKSRDEFLGYGGEVEYHFPKSDNKRSVAPLSIEEYLQNGNHPDEVDIVSDVVISIHYLPEEYEGNVFKYLHSDVAF